LDALADGWVNEKFGRKIKIWKPKTGLSLFGWLNKLPMMLVA
jgi:hypothetical protein